MIFTKIEQEGLLQFFYDNEKLETSQILYTSVRKSR